eukprot:gb/GFBE01047958.1/.p1 GENE.gb/GFBE01047958.1/~~gb/GFBE01047958.1/.p1  ORF type:complete len:484 (+),score=82.88 gb/GFBE01047958.1/:1-1452(+)
MEGSSTSPAHPLWLHRCHGGLDGQPLTAIQVNRAPPNGIAENFAAEASSDENMLGVRCRIEDNSLIAECEGQEAVAIVTSLIVTEVMCCPFPSESWADMAVIAVVPPANGQGIRGTSIAGDDLAGAQGWFIVLQGIQLAYDVVDYLSLQGCLRNNLEQAFMLASEGDCIIGEGAYATVYHMQARDGRAVAVKQMNYTNDFESIEREVSALVELQGENVVGFRGIFWRRELEQIRFSAVFDLAPCGDLLYKILKTGVMTEATARPLFTGIMRGLQRIHEANIVHRDIKTENILLQAGNIPMVADFGLACLITDEQQMSRRCGSAGFVAPEVCLGNPYDCKVDNFGAGVILYFMLSKMMPFSSPDRDSAATMRKTVTCSLHLHVPPFDAMTSRLRNVLRQLICKSQDDRLTAEGALQHSWITKKSDKSGASSSGKKKEKTASASPAPPAPPEGEDGGAAEDAAQPPDSTYAGGGYPIPPPAPPPS